MSLRTAISRPRGLTSGLIRQDCRALLGVGWGAGHGVSGGHQRSSLWRGRESSSAFRAPAGGPDGMSSGPAGWVALSAWGLGGVLGGLQAGCGGRCGAAAGGGCELGETFMAPVDSGVHVRRLLGWRFVPGVLGAGRGRQRLGADGCGWRVGWGGLEASGWRCSTGRCGDARRWAPVEEGGS